MSHPIPSDTVFALVDAVNQGKLQTALAQYESGARFVVQPGEVTTGAVALSDVIGRMIALKPVMTAVAHQTIENGDLALYLSKWRLTGTAADGSAVQLEGASADVLRRQPDGTWLIAIDNPWGPSILG